MSVDMAVESIYRSSKGSLSLPPTQTPESGHINARVCACEVTFFRPRRPENKSQPLIYGSASTGQCVCVSSTRHEDHYPSETHQFFQFIFFPINIPTIIIMYVVLSYIVLFLIYTVCAYALYICVYFNVYIYIYTHTNIFVILLIYTFP